MVIGLFGILKAGGAYVPLDPTNPRERLSSMLADKHIKILLTRRRFVETLSDSGAELICLDDPEAFSGEHTENPNPNLSSDNLAYIIYTSGSTGGPKGVGVTHRSILARVHFLIRKYRLAPGASQLQFLGPGFDAFGDELFPTLCCGATLTMIPDLSSYTAGELLAKCGELGINKLSLPSSYWRRMVAEWSLTGRPVPETITLLSTGGEKATVEDLIKWANMATHSSIFIHCYGPTEATITATSYEVALEPGSVRRPQKLPIGRAVEDTQIYILNDHLRPAPIGASGELYIGGVGVARGYFHCPAPTAESFIPDLFSDEPGARLYRTGDRAYYLPDGQIDFLGRNDHQVKVRGYRIELGEIETALASHPGVREAAALIKDHSDGGRQIVAYLVAEPMKELTTADLRDFLLARLPEYMVPSTFYLFETLPLSINGKVDRRALSALNVESIVLSREHMAPRTPVEMALVEIWREVLNVERIGVNDNFFELGGHSLLATQTVSRIRDSFRVELPLLKLFESPTIAGIASSIESLAVEREQDQISISRAPRIPEEGDLPLSFAQQRLWFIDQLEPDSPLYNISLA
ncbi:MAG: non-ribosomal peptide synthetase, partial [Blastocatellia bacterium]